MRIPVVLLSVGVALGFGAPAAFAGPDQHYSLGLGVEYSRGDFDTPSTSTYATVPLIFDWYPNQRFAFELTIPYVFQKSSNVGYAASGSGIMMGSGGGMMAAAQVMTGDQGMDGGQGMSGTGATVAASGGGEQSGLGDISLETGYNLFLDGEGSADLALRCYLKFPTADEDKGLGTGSFDWGPGLHLSKWLGDWQPFLEGRYIFQGASRAESGALDYLFAEAGLGYGWSDQLYLAGFSRLGTAAFDGMAAPLELRLKTVWNFAETNSVEIYLAKGFSAGSPDYGGGLSFFTGF